MVHVTIQYPKVDSGIVKTIQREAVSPKYFPIKKDEYYQPLVAIKPSALSEEGNGRQLPTNGMSLKIMLLHKQVRKISPGCHNVFGP